MSCPAFPFYFQTNLFFLFPQMCVKWRVYYCSLFLLLKDVEKIFLNFLWSTKGTKSKIRSCLLLLCSKFSMLTLPNLTGCSRNLLCLFLSCSELFPWAQKVSTKPILAVWGEGDQALAHSPARCSCLAEPVEWAVEVIKKKGGAQEFWTGYEIAEQHSQRFGNPLQVSSKAIWGLGSNRATAAEEALAEVQHLRSTAHPVQLWAWLQIFIPLCLSPTHGALTSHRG